MRVHAVHVPHASRASPSPVGVRQLSDCATAIAMSRTPAPAGPEKIKLGGSASRATERASSAASLGWPQRLTTSPYGMGLSLSFLSSDLTSPYTVALVRQVVQQLQDVRENAHRGDVGAGTRSLDDERRPAVPLGRERDDVVAAFGRRDWVRLRKLLQSGLRAPALEHAHISEHVPASGGRCDTLGDLMVVPREILEELLGELSVTQRTRHEAVDSHLVELHLQADLA